jgi:hypothetical protein
MDMARRVCGTQHELTELQHQVLRLLGVPASAYLDKT